MCECVWACACVGMRLWQFITQFSPIVTRGVYVIQLLFQADFTSLFQATIILFFVFLFFILRLVVRKSCRELCQYFIVVRSRFPPLFLASASLRTYS